MSGETVSLGEECLEGNTTSCNFDNIRISLKNGLLANDDVDLASYIAAYKELYKFFILLGGAFQFMATDVKSKIKIIEDLQNDERVKTKAVKNFLSVGSMIVYEKEAKLLSDQNYISGSRTILRLHRGLDFVRHFFLDLSEVEDNTKISGVCRETYDKTLANYHTWVVKNSARLAMKLLPTKEVILNKMSNNDPAVINHAKEMMPELLDVMKVTYDRVQKLYSDHELLELP